VEAALKQQALVLPVTVSELVISEQSLPAKQSTVSPLSIMLESAYKQRNNL